MADDRFRQLCFNELTLQPECIDETEMFRRIHEYAKVLQSAQKQIGTKVVRYESDLSNIWLSKETSLMYFCTKYHRDASLIAILSMHTMPQVDPENKTVNKAYQGTSVSLTIDGNECSSLGLSASYVYGVPSVGFASSQYWNDVMHDIHITSKDFSVGVKWPCLTSPDHFQQEEFAKWMQEHKDIQIVPTKLQFKDKEVNLRDDHGKDVLEKHATLICQNEYVEGVLCSLPFKPHWRTYILNTADDGIVDIVLFWDDRGLSMRVKTTGRNIQETNAIAAILKEKYSK